MDPVKNEEENTGGGLPATTINVNYWPENCVGPPQSPQRPSMLAFYIYFNFTQQFPGLSE